VSYGLAGDRVSSGYDVPDLETVDIGIEVIRIKFALVHEPVGAHLDLGCLQ
jgi:hypothetical protein